MYAWWEQAIIEGHRRDPADVLRRRYAFRWERVEREAAAIEAGEMREGCKAPRDMHHTWDEVLERRKMRMGDPAENRRERQRRYRAKLQASGCKRADGTYTSFKKHPPIDERELYGAASLSDRIRVVTPEEMAKLG